MTTIYLSLGSNLGDRKQHLLSAVEALKESFNVTQISSIYETAPVGGVPQDDFYNMCAVIETDCSPEEVLDVCQAIEQQLNRVRKIHWGPRTIDLDILLVENEVLDSERLKVPHPYMTERSFVLIPLNEIAPEVVHPEKQRMIKELVYPDPEVRKIK